MNKYIRSASQLLAPIDMTKISKEMSVYELVSVLSARAKQINNKLKDELNHYTDEVYALPNSLNQTTVADIEERVKISKQYEKMPKPLAIAVEEFFGGVITYRAREAENPN
jgi:DNA-directed RNA polymerase subunit K/omega